VLRGDDAVDLRPGNGPVVRPPDELAAVGAGPFRPDLEFRRPLASKIGREANVFDTDFSYRGLIDALRTNDPAKFLYTVEFFPEEGKYITTATASAASPARRGRAWRAGISAPSAARS